MAVGHGSLRMQGLVSQARHAIENEGFPQQFGKLFEGDAQVLTQEQASGEDLGRQL